MDILYRKLQNLGGSLYVNLPKTWINKYQLKEKSPIALEIRDDGTLLILPKIEQESEIMENEIILDADEYVIWELLKKSLAGEKNITIISDKKINRELRKNIGKYVNRLPNTEIIEETDQKIKIQNFGYKEIPTKKLIQRLLYLVANMFEDLEKELFQDVYDNFEQLRKFYFILVIHIRTYLKTGIYSSSTSEFTPLEAMDFRMFSEKVVELAETLKDFRLSEGVLEFYHKAKQYYEEVMEAFLKKNDKLAFWSWVKKDLLVSDANEILKTLEHEDQDKIKELLRIIQNCKDMAALI